MFCPGHLRTINFGGKYSMCLEHELDCDYLEETTVDCLLKLHCGCMCVSGGILFHWLM